jgi:DNA polymerase/3'-5' exonuclease PolX
VPAALTAALAIPLEDARRLAEWLQAALGPACARLEVAGSCRRERPAVKDLELVAIPRAFDAQGDLFGSGGASCRELWAALEALRRAGELVPLKPGAPGLEPDPRWPFKGSGDDRYYRLLCRGIKVDLFLTTPEAWGWTLALRTGPQDVSKALVSVWAPRAGLRARDGRLFRGLVPVFTPEEVDAFAALRLEWISPPRRVSAASLRMKGKT